MTDKTNILPDQRIYPVLKKYADGDLSAVDAAYEVQKMKIPDIPFPSASEIILWSRAIGLSLPEPDQENIEDQIEEILANMPDK